MFHIYYVNLSEISSTFSCAKFQYKSFDRANKSTFIMSVWVTLSHFELILVTFFTFSIFESLWVTSSHFESFWVILSHFESFCFTLSHFESLSNFGSLWVTLSHFMSLLVIFSHFESLSVTFSHFESLCVILSHFWSLWVTFSHFESLVFFVCFYATTLAENQFQSVWSEEVKWMCIKLSIAWFKWFWEYQHGEGPVIKGVPIYRPPGGTEIWPA